jgi:hypothetical protein
MNRMTNLLMNKERGIAAKQTPRTQSNQDDKSRKEMHNEVSTKP